VTLEKKISQLQIRCTIPLVILRKHNVC